MTDSRQFLCTVVTPEKIVLERQVSFAAVPAHDGEIGFLKGRAPLVVKLDVGRLRVETGEGEEELFIDGGFAEMVHDKLTILTEDARRPDELDRDQVLALRGAASEQEAFSEEQFASRQRALKRARTQVRMIEE
jgi:F-type H+-transporting ATPase subunit epsilon